MVRGISAIRSRAIPRVEAIPGVYATVAVFAVAFPLLAYNCAPGISFHDSGEFSLALHSAGIPHSPGAPTWVILNLLFKLLTFGAEAARSANLFSAFCGAATTAFASAFVFRHFSDRANPIRWLAATITALAILCTGAFLEQSFIAEQYTLMTASIAAILLVVQTNEANPMPRWYYLMGLLWGLDVGNHPSQVIMGFLMLLPVIQKRKEVSIFKSIPLGLLGLATGLLVFIYLPIRASANPVMNWGHPSTWQQFLWNIKREQWDTRPFTDAPTGFIAAWFRSYNLFGEMGILSTILAVVGFVLGFRRAIRPLSWILFATIPYALILMLGHIHQKGMDLMYIRVYGVRDWHIPLYMGFAMMAAMGAVWLIDMRHKITDRGRIFGLGVVTAGLLAFLPFQFAKETLRGYEVPASYAEHYAVGLPDNAILATYSDNGSHIFGYEHFAKGKWPGVYFTFGMPQNGLNEKNSKGWDIRLKGNFLRYCITAPTQNPITLPYRLTDKEIYERPLFTEFNGGDCKWLGDYCLPHGWLVQIVERKTTDEEVRKADKEFLAAHPELLARPNGPQHRLTQEAMSYAHVRRSFFYMKRKMWTEAKAALELAMEWGPHNPQILFAYASTLEEMKDYVGAEKAYLTCIDWDPDWVSPRHNLALLYAYYGQLPLAKKYIDEEYELSKHAEDDRKVRELVYGKMGLKS